MTAAPRPGPGDAPACVPPDLVSPRTPWMLAPLRGLGLLLLPVTVVGAVGQVLRDGPAGVELTGCCCVGLDVLGILGGVTLAWNARTGHRKLRDRGLLPLLAGASLLFSTTLPAAPSPGGPTWTVPVLAGCALAGVGTGMLTAYWLRARSGPLQVPTAAPGPAGRVWFWLATGPLALVGLLLCAARTQNMIAPDLLGVHLFTVWLVVALVRTPHARFTRMFAWVGRIGRARAAHPRPDRFSDDSRSADRDTETHDPTAGSESTTDPDGGAVGQPKAPAAQRPVEERTDRTSAPDRTEDRDHAEDPQDEPGSGGGRRRIEDPDESSDDQVRRIYVGRSGRLIDLDRIPAELRLTRPEPAPAPAPAPDDHTG